MRLTPSERKALYWLLNATDSGSIIAGASNAQIRALQEVKLKLLNGSEK
jgi:hypothetical protein